jgi:hypothetical protein
MDLRNLKRRNLRVKKNPAALEIIRTFHEAARVIGYSRMALYRWRSMFGDFPSLPSFRIAVVLWRRSFNFRRGPQPSQRRKMVVCLRGEGMTFSEIGKKLGISRGSAWGLWQRHLKSQTGICGKGSLVTDRS